MADHPDITTDPAALREYLVANIPVLAPMGLSVIDLAPGRVAISAPLAANTNHRGTAFGGSISTLAILTGWAWLHLELKRLGVEHRLVIHRNTIEYSAPVVTDFSATAHAPGPAEWERFVRGFRQRGRSRIQIGVTVSSDGVGVAAYTGSYAALAKDSHAAVD